MKTYHQADRMIRIEPRYRDDQGRLVEPRVYENDEGVEYTMSEFVDEHNIGAM